VAATSSEVAATTASRQAPEWAHSLDTSTRSWLARPFPYRHAAAGRRATDGSASPLPSHEVVGVKAGRTSRGGCPLCRQRVPHRGMTGRYSGTAMAYVLYLTIVLERVPVAVGR
jgi:hypothetical protein